MPDVVTALQVVVLYKLNGVLKVRADYLKSVVEEDLHSGFSRDVTAVLPNWGLEAKWNSIEQIIQA